ncbi:hypothetical protein [Thioalkalivibrio sulfidiphilus]|uniref:DUF4426 domain-containing protein n=1 Tax=Thioalkalivibrio sulfidiphilus (strain HL-EbGR7) TaxID=396588 RepID=B8GM06_THISH|nr:hypothetical protein [Thioalkalivibrio sulfidiphilus]ACL73593.1 conserved hypothetical protein [Thioalkalivibrio sulfidiphilus HL-EbGr7]
MNIRHIFSSMIAVSLWVALLGFHTATADPGYRQVANGTVVYLGVLPAAMVRGHHEDHPEAVMHNGIPRGRHVFHVMAAVFDAESGDQIKDAQVEARVAALGLAGVSRPLESMRIDDTITYGNYFTLRGEGPYDIQITIARPGADTPAIVRFTYVHPPR